MAVKDLTEELLKEISQAVLREMEKMTDKVEEKIKGYMKYLAFQKWFLKNGERYLAPATEKANVECLELWCSALDKNPDELVPSNLKEAKTNGPLLNTQLNTILSASVTASNSLMVVTI